MGFFSSVRSMIVRWYHAHRGWAGYLTVFTIAFLLFAYFQHVDVFADPDSYYHAEMAVQMRDGAFSTTFSALPYTTLAHSFADQHFLYHLLLVPFVTIADPLIGLKLATVVLGALLALTFYWFLRRWGVHGAFVTTLVLLMVNPFTFRMNLAKASSLSLTLLILGLAAAFSYRPWLVAVLSFCYVWFYGGFPLLVFSVLLFAVVSALHRRYIRKEDSNTLLQRVRSMLGRTFRHRKVRRLNLRMAVAVLAGTSLGVLINPFFPSNVRFYFDQLIRIGIVNYQKVIGVGGEWYPYKFMDLVANTVLVSIPLVVALVLFVIYFRKQTTRSITLFFLWLFFFLLTLKSRRYVEYYVPFSLLFAAFSINDSLNDFRWRDAWRYLRTSFFKSVPSRIVLIALTLYCAVMIPTIVIRDFVSERRDLASGFPLGIFSEESEWIAAQGKPGSVVVHSDWDEFPVLFYYNSTSRYIAGLDPTFFYLQDKTRYHQWVALTTGKERGDIYNIVSGSLRGDYVLIAHDHAAMRALIQNDPHFTLGFTGPDANVYSVEQPR